MNPPYLATSVFPFRSNVPDELSFAAGATILVLSSDVPFNDSWLRGCLRDGTVGLFPSSFIAPSDGPIDAFISSIGGSNKLLMSEISDLLSLEPLAVPTNLPQPESIHGWSPFHVAAWASSYGMHRHARMLLAHGIDGELLLSQSLSSLRRIGIASLSDRIAIIDKISHLKQSFDSPGSHSLNHSNDSPEPIQELSQDVHQQQTHPIHDNHDNHEPTLHQDQPQKETTQKESFMKMPFKFSFSSLSRKQPESNPIPDPSFHGTLLVRLHNNIKFKSRFCAISADKLYIANSKSHNPVAIIHLSLGTQILPCSKKPPFSFKLSPSTDHTGSSIPPSSQNIPQIYFASNSQLEITSWINAIVKASKNTSLSPIHLVPLKKHHQISPSEMSILTSHPSLSSTIPRSLGSKITSPLNKTNSLLRSRKSIQSLFVSHRSSIQSTQFSHTKSITPTAKFVPPSYSTMPSAKFIPNGPISPKPSYSSLNHDLQHDLFHEYRSRLQLPICPILSSPISSSPNTPSVQDDQSSHDDFSEYPPHVESVTHQLNHTYLD